MRIVIGDWFNHLIGATTMAKVYMTEIANVLDTDEQLTTFMSDAVLAPETSKRAPALVAWRFSNILTPEQQSAFVDPGSRQKDRTDGRGRKLSDNEAKAWDEGKLWDYYQYPSPTTGEIIRGQWYVDEAAKTKACAAINKIRDQLRAAKGGIKADTTDEYLNMTPEDLDNAISQWDQRATRYANVQRTAVKIMQQWAEIEERLGHVVEIDWNYARDDKQSDGLSSSLSLLKVFALYTKSDFPEGKPELIGVRRGAYRAFTVSDFLNLSVDAAIEKGVDTPEGKVATYVSLIKSERTKPAPASGKGKKPEAQAMDSAVTPTSFLNVAAHLELFMASQDKWMAFLKEYASLPEGNEKKNQYRLTLGRIEKRLSVFMNNERKKYYQQEMELKRKEEEETAAQDKSDAA